MKFGFNSETLIPIRELRFSKAPSPIKETLVGIVMSVNDPAPENAYEPILVTLDGMLRLVSDVAL